MKAKDRLGDGSANCPGLRRFLNRTLIEVAQRSTGLWPGRGFSD